MKKDIIPRCNDPNTRKYDEISVNYIIKRKAYDIIRYFLP